MQRHGDCLLGDPPCEDDSNYNQQWTIHGGVRTAFRRHTARINPTANNVKPVDRAKSKENEISVKSFLTHVSHEHQFSCVEAVTDATESDASNWLAIERKSDCTKMNLLFPKALAAQLVNWMLLRLAKADISEEMRRDLAKKVSRSKSAALEVFVQSGWMQWGPGAQQREKLLFMPSVVQNTRSTCIRLALSSASLLLLLLLSSWLLL